MTKSIKKAQSVKPVKAWARVYENHIWCIHQPHQSKDIVEAQLTHGERLIRVEVRPVRKQK